MDVVQAWIDNVAYSHSKSANTAIEYRSVMKEFSEFIGKTPKKILDEYEASDERQFKRKYAQYLRAFIANLGAKGHTVNTISVRVGVVKSFFKYNDLPLAFVPLAKNRVTYHNRDIMKEEIENILKPSTIREKAFYCMMAQGGFRPETLCNLKLKHIEPDFSQGIVPCGIVVPQELAKGKYGSYFTFVAKESINFLKAYFSTRPNLTKEDYLFANYGTKNQANPKSFSRIFARTIQKLRDKGIIDYELRGNRKPSELRLYILRKYFRNNAGQAGPDYVNFWMGHKANYKAPNIPASDEHYFSRENIEFQRKLYAEKAMPFLRLETATPTETDLTIQKQAKEIDDLKEKLRNLENSVVLKADLSKPITAAEKAMGEQYKDYATRGKGHDIMLQFYDGFMAYLKEVNPEAYAMLMKEKEKK